MYRLTHQAWNHLSVKSPMARVWLWVKLSSRLCKTKEMEVWRWMTNLPIACSSIWIERLNHYRLIDRHLRFQICQNSKAFSASKEHLWMSWLRKRHLSCLLKMKMRRNFRLASDQLLFRTHKTRSCHRGLKGTLIMRSLVQRTSFCRSQSDIDPHWKVGLKYRPNFCSWKILRQRTKWESNAH